MTSTTRRYVALGHDFGLVCDHPVLDGYLRGLLAPFARTGTPHATYRLERSTREGTAVDLSFDGEPLASDTDHAHAVAMLLWHLNRHVVEVSTGHVLFHAAVAASHGRAVLLPAAMESGKTTLVAGLVRAGMRYLSDEIAALDPGTLRVEAYPKALSVDPGSWEVLSELEPDVPDGLSGLLPYQWQVPATSVRPDALVPQADPVLVVMPRYVPEAPTTLEEVEPLDVVRLLAGCTFELQRQPDRDLDVIVRLARRTSSYRLTYSSLAAACDAVLDLMQTRQDAVA